MPCNSNASLSILFRVLEHSASVELSCTCRSRTFCMRLFDIEAWDLYSCHSSITMGCFWRSSAKSMFSRWMGLEVMLKGYSKLDCVDGVAKLKWRSLIEVEPVPSKNTMDVVKTIVRVETLKCWSQSRCHMVMAITWLKHMQRWWSYHTSTSWLLTTMLCHCSRCYPAKKQLPKTIKRHLKEDQDQLNTGN